MRLAQFIAQSGHSSRRQASRLIEQQRVRVNGVLATHLSFVDVEDHVMVDEQPLEIAQSNRYFLFHKPVGVDCNLNIDDKDSLIHLLPLSDTLRLFPVGRLDKDSCGLLILTNDGHLTHRWLSPQFKQPKCYEVCVLPTYWRQQQGAVLLDDKFITGMNTPMLIKGKATQQSELTISGYLTFTIVMMQGLNRQIRRMCAKQGYQVTHLKRVGFAGFRLGDLAVGAYKELTTSEIDSR